MNFKNLIVTKANGEQEPFSIQKFRNSLSRARASEEEANIIIETIGKKLYPGIRTREIYKMASRLLKRQAPSHAARFNLKKAIMELGPSGYPFERFVAALFEEEGFSTQVGKVFQGKCVTHEIDVIGTKGTELMLVECKYHNTSGIHVDVKVPLYIHSRFQDLLDNNLMGKTYTGFTGWIATNSKFSDDAIAFARCKGMQLLGWGFPEGNSLKDRIDRTGLYPVTCLSTLTQAEKSFLMEKHIVLARELYANPDWLRKAGVQEPRFRETILELEHLLNQARPST